MAFLKFMNRLFLIKGLGAKLLNFGVITLNPENYYVSEAPIYLNFGYIILVNIGTLILCLLMLIIPTIIIYKICGLWNTKAC